MPLIADIDFKALVADKAFDSNAIRAELDERGALAVIPSKADRKPLIPHDAEMYKWRHLIENYFQQFRHIATRYAKTDTSFAAALYSSPQSSHCDECLQALVRRRAVCPSAYASAGSEPPRPWKGGAPCYSKT